MTITITFPDGTKREFESGITAIDIAKSISEGLMRATLAAEIDGKVCDATDPINKDAAVRLLTFKDPEGKDVFWHSASHLMTQAILRVKGKHTGLGVGFPVEDGFYQDYDLKDPLHPEDLEKIEAEMKKIVKERLAITKKFISKEEALEFYKHDPYKQELVKDVPGDTVTMYCQGEFENLCKGPHVPNTSYMKAFKLLKIAGAYWRGDAKNKQLQRVYGIAFPDKKELRQHLQMLEEAKKRDHRILVKKLDLGSFQEESPGSFFYHPKGTILYRELQEFIRQEYWKRGFEEVITPLVYDKKLWETSGHWEFYKDNMFTFKADGKEVSLKPMNCPSHCLIFRTSTKSYRDLPIRIADFASLHRNELKGVLGGMTRVRKFNQDDAHIFCRLDQLQEELDRCIDFANYVYSDVFNFEFHLELSTKPEKATGTQEQWDAAEGALKSALDKKKLNYVINEGDGAFYGPKIDLHIKDCLGRSWQLSTIQVDFQMPGRFDLVYEGNDGKKHHPVMIHRAVLGTLDRFIGILIEHYAGKFPLWLAPVQVQLLTINDNVLDYAQKISDELRKHNIRVEINAKTETMNKKVREAQLQYIPLMLTIGEKEKTNNTLAVRTLDGQVKFGLSVDDFVAKVKQAIADKALSLKLE